MSSFAPHHEDVADELARVCRPGGTIGMLNWTPEGMIGALFRTMGPFAPPPPPGAQPPPLWGSEDHVRELFADRVEFGTLERDDLEITAFEHPRDYGALQGSLRPDHRRPRQRVEGKLGRGAPPDLLGQTVVTPTGGSGGYAEQVAVPAAAIIAVPDGVDVRDAVALLADGRTALALVEAADLRPGETVLVEAAAGGVGSCLVQLALAAGARVIACAGGAEKAAIGVQLGAALAFDYADDTWDQGVRDAVGAVDVVFDGVGGVIGARAAGLLRPGGRFCRYGMASGTFTDLATARPANDVELRGLALTPQATRRLSTTALAQAAAGGLRPVVGQIFALEDAGRAHAAIEARVTIGKTLLDTDADAGVGARQEAA